MANAQDYRHMALALRLAERGLNSTDPNPRVGCVLAHGDQVVGRGFHRRAGEVHAEVAALAEAGERARDATAYVTLEPCCHYGRTPPCTDALIGAGVKRVVAAMEDPHHRVAGKGFAQLRAAGVAVEVGVMAELARALNPGFIQRMTYNRPWVRGKLAMGLDGRTAMASGESQWITGPAARRDVHRWRARASAVATGAATLLADDPALNQRLNPDEAERQPLRVIFDPRLETPATAKTLTLPGSVLILTAVGDQQRRQRLLAAVNSAASTRCRLEICQLPGDEATLDLAAALAELARRDVNELHLECGARLLGAFVEAGLLDELILYMAPLMMGDSGRGLAHLPALARLAQAPRWQLLQSRAIGRDWRLLLRPSSTD